MFIFQKLASKSRHYMNYAIVKNLWFCPERCDSFQIHQNNQMDKIEPNHILPSQVIVHQLPPVTFTSSEASMASLLSNLL